MNRAIVLLLMLGIGACIGVASAETLSAADVAPYVHPQRLVDAGGHKLNIYCTGSGSPVVILDAGQADTTFEWRKVQPNIARFTRVCSFDRAGMGFSAAGPLPRDARAMVTDLHALLQRANVAEPIVYVGHSIAGLYALLYADRFPTDVSGMVLVDPSFPNQTQAFHAVSPTILHMEGDANAADTFCYEAAAHGKLGIGRASQAYALCGFPPNLESDLHMQCAKNGRAWCDFQHVRLRRYVRASFWAAYRSEDMASYDEDSAEVLQAQRTFGSMPLIVLTAANDVGDSPLPAPEMRAVDRVVMAGHDRIARLSTVGVNELVPQSEHDIELDQPAAVVGAVAEVVSQAQKRFATRP